MTTELGAAALTLVADVAGDEASSVVAFKRWSQELEDETEDRENLKANANGDDKTATMGMKQSMGSEEDATPRFEVSYTCLSDVDNQTEGNIFGLRTIDECGLTGLQYLDVLLQTDANGIGINVGLHHWTDEGGDSDRVLVVQSFRRLREGDVGPAEACGKVRVGDILHSIDGEAVSSLPQLHSQLAGRLGTPRKFVLLRFLRPVDRNSDSRSRFIAGATPTDQQEKALSCLEVETLLKRNPDLAVAVRQLAKTNELLQEQLVESKLKQEEQNIQLDQLHALYARTQAEGLPLFSLSKSIRPFSRRANAADGPDSLARKSIPSKIHTEVADAVNAEYARLRHEFDLQLKIEKHALEKKYAEKAQQLRNATEKKLQMLEAGFQEALAHCSKDQHCRCNCVNGKVPTQHGQNGTGKGVKLQILKILREYENNKATQKMVVDGSK